MKRHLTLSTILLLASLPSFAYHQPSSSNQFRVKRGHALPKPTLLADLKHPGLPTSPVLPAHAQTQSMGACGLQHHSSKRAIKSSNAPTTTVGLVSALQIPTGGYDDDETFPVIGDFNGDGKPDVAKIIGTRVCRPTYSISVVLSNGNGTFKTPVLTAPSNNSDDSIMVGDVNGDGKDDILQVHPNSEPPSADIWLSNGDGTFTLKGNTQLSTSSLNGGVITDINGDGKLDLVVVDSENPGLVIASLGNGDGTFQAPSTIATLGGQSPFDITFADFNGDGKIDFVGTNEGGQFMVYLASGSTFAAPTTLLTSDGNEQWCIYTTGDLNGDGRPEIVATNCGPNTITVYVNNGDGSFQPGFYYNNGGDANTFPLGVSIADLNGNGKNDIAVSDANGGAISIFFGNGDGTVRVPKGAFAVGGDPWTSPIIADFNGDGLADIIEADDNYSLAYLQGYGDGTFRAARSYDAPDSFTQDDYSYGIASGDFNGDGFADVVIGQDANNDATGVVVYLSNADGTFQPGVSYGTSSTLAYVTVADFNGDKKLDIAATDYRNGVVQIFLGNGDGTFTPGASYATDSNGPVPVNLVTGDFNHDGKVDLAVVNSDTATVGVLFGNGDGTFGGLVDYPVWLDLTPNTPNALNSPSATYPFDIATADLNGDGYLDLAVTLENNSGAGVAIFLGNTDNSGTFQQPAYVTTGSGDFQYLALGDLNGDGKVDLAASATGTSSYPGAMVIALGNGDGTFQAATAYPTSTQDAGLAWTDPGKMRMADVDGDGKLDLVYTNFSFGTVGLLYGHGDGTFLIRIEFPPAVIPGTSWSRTLTATAHSTRSLPITTRAGPPFC